MHGTDHVDEMITTNMSERNANSTVLSFVISNHIHSDSSKCIPFKPIDDRHNNTMCSISHYELNVKIQISANVVRGEADKERNEFRIHAKLEPILTGSIDRDSLLHRAYNQVTKHLQS
jgi:hypothetical protein